MSTNFNLEKEVNNFILEERLKQVEQREEKYGSGRGGFFVTDAGKCPRQVFYDFKVPEKRESPDAHSIRRMDVGNYIEKRWEHYFTEMGLLTSSQNSVNTKNAPEVPFVMYGRFDFKIADHEGLEYIVELKNVNTWGFKATQQEGRPKLDHYYQLQLYMWMTGIHRGWLIYEDKNDQSTEYFYIEYDPRVVHGDEKVKGLIHELYELAVLIDEEKTPERCADAKPDGFPCKWKSGQCGYYNFCYDPNHNGIIGNTQQQVEQPKPIEPVLFTLGDREIDLANLPEDLTLKDVEKTAFLLGKTEEFLEAKTILLERQNQDNTTPEVESPEPAAPQPEPLVLEIAGKQIDLANLPEGYTIEDIEKMAVTFDKKDEFFNLVAKHPEYSKKYQLDVPDQLQKEETQSYTIQEAQTLEEKPEQQLGEYEYIVQEYHDQEGNRCITCGQCQRELSFKRVVGGKIKCRYCKATNYLENYM